MNQAHNIIDFELVQLGSGVLLAEIDTREVLLLLINTTELLVLSCLNLFIVIVSSDVEASVHAHGPTYVNDHLLLLLLPRLTVARAHDVLGDTVLLHFETSLLDLGVVLPMTCKR